jgi:para-nitrobenzyl esterase
VVETRAGRVRGVARDGVLAFLGIPFAAPPTGAGRFRPPRPAEPWPGVREAQAFGAPAPQNAGMVARLLGLGASEASEDCLHLNVFTPATDSGRRPVMVWVHGGSFTSGTGGSPVYDGTALARRGDVMVVTLNYRLGVLGFLAHERFAAEDGGTWGNAGLLDQVAALAWVREHAPAFGGDPDNVTLFGESAGAMAVATLLGTPAARPLFRRAILQSGGAENVSDRDEAERVAARVLTELGIAPERAERLREVPVDALLAAQERTVAALWREVRGLTFQPVVDGAVVPAPPLEAVAGGDAADVPLLLGSNRDEYKLWGPTDPGARGLDADALRRRLERNVPGRDVAGVPWADRILETYRRARAGVAPVDPPELWFAVETDRLLRAPLLRLAARHAVHQPDTWVYLFTWSSPAMEGALGACHALEIPFVFGTLEQPALRAFTGGGPEALRLSERMQDAWVAFARDGRPCHPGLPDWRPYEAGTRSTQLLGRACPVERAPAEAERALWDEVAASR